MKQYGFGREKNELIKSRHGVSFEEIIDALEDNKIFAAFPHQNYRKYSNQTILIVEIREYAYVIPVIENEQSIFLKTAFPSRKYTKKYLNRKNGGI